MDPKLTENYHAAQRPSVFLREPHKYVTKAPWYVVGFDATCCMVIAISLGFIAIATVGMI
jgi:hypothetical protein